MILGEVKARPKDIISFSLDYISKSKVQTSNPSSSPIPLDTPARPADFGLYTKSINARSVGNFGPMVCNLDTVGYSFHSDDSNRFPSPTSRISPESLLTDWGTLWEPFTVWVIYFNSVHEI